jgi:hypothetical protein
MGSRDFSVKPNSGRNRSAIPSLFFLIIRDAHIARSATCETIIDGRASQTTEIVRALEKGIEAKASKYEFKPRLLVYLNFPLNAEVEPAIKESVKYLQHKFADRWSDIHVITDRAVLS